MRAQHHLVVVRRTTGRGSVVCQQHIKKTKLNRSFPHRTTWGFTHLPRHKYLGGLEGVVGREGDVQEEHAPLVHGARRSQDGGPPLINVVSFGAGAADKHSNH